MNWLDAILKRSRGEGAEEPDFTQIEAVYPVKFSQENERKAADWKKTFAEGILGQMTIKILHKMSFKFPRSKRNSLSEKRGNPFNRHFTSEDTQRLDKQTLDKRFVSGVVGELQSKTVNRECAGNRRRVSGAHPPRSRCRDYGVLRPKHSATGLCMMVCQLWKTWDTRAHTHKHPYAHTFSCGKTQ